MPLDAAHPLASGWLLASLVGFSALFGVPLTLVPLRWARWFGWRVPERDAELSIYFGRCLGAVILVLAYLMLDAAVAPARGRWAFDVFTLAGAAMTLVHGWGWLRGIQPPRENAETV